MQTFGKHTTKKSFYFIDFTTVKMGSTPNDNINSKFIELKVNVLNVNKLSSNCKLYYKEKINKNIMSSNL